MGTPPPHVALDHLELLAGVKPEKLARAAVCWHGRLDVPMHRRHHRAKFPLLG
jgi:hypothetical protein